MSGQVRPLLRCGSKRDAGLSALRVQVTSHNDAVLVRLVGVLEAADASRVRQRLLTLLSDVPRIIVVDASGLSVRAEVLETLLAGVAAQNQIWPRVRVVVAGCPRASARSTSWPGGHHLLSVAPSAGEAMTRLPRHRPRARRTTPLPAAPLAASRARTIVGRQCRDRGVDHLTEPTQLVASELVTNAVSHVGYGIRLTVEADADAMTVEVRDADPAAPELRHRDPLDEHGRGLGVVNASVSAWGCMPTRPGGKVVWAAWALDKAYVDACIAENQAF